jgi:hypothetical protein
VEGSVALLPGVETSMERKKVGEYFSDGKTEGK